MFRVFIFKSRAKLLHNSIYVFKVSSVAVVIESVADNKIVRNVETEIVDVQIFLANA